jgi:hypothetical protein
MATTTVSASGNATKVIVKEQGPRGVDGTPGADGSGFNNVRKTKIDNPTCWLYKKNRLVNVLSTVLTVTRSTASTFKDMHDLVATEIADTPREGGSGWLFEAAGTNICLQSQTFSTTWSQSNLTVTDDADDAPDTTTTADKLVESVGASLKDISQAITVSNATEYTLSVFAKAASRDYIYLQDIANSDNGAYFNLTTGAVGTTDGGIVAKIEEYANGYYRCSIQSTSTSTSGGVKIQLADIDGAGTYTGDGTSGVFVWGAQLEESGFETSYIATTTTSETRSAESHTFPVLNNIPFLKDGFSFVLTVDNYNEQSATQDLITVPDGTAGDVFKLNTVAGKWEATIKGSDAIDYLATTTIDAVSDSVQTLVVTVDNVGVIDLYVNGSIVNGTATIATGLAGVVDTTGDVSIAVGGDFKTNVQGLRFFDFVLNTDEIDYLN